MKGDGGFSGFGGGRGFGGRGRGGFGQGNFFGQSGAKRSKGVKRPIEDVDPTKWTEAYDRALPPEIVNMCTMAECGVCKVPLNGPAVAQSHYDGKNHDRKVQTILAEMFPDPELAPKRIKMDDEVVPKKKERPPRPEGENGEERERDTTVYYCQICNLTCTSRIVYDSHMSGKTHASR
jgi:hypothetical protein